MRRSLACLILAWMALFQVPETQARCGDPPSCADLNGITGIGIIVEKSDLDAPNGLTKESIKQTVSAALRTRLPRLKTKNRGFPFLYVRVSTLALPIAVGGRGFTYAYAINVQLKALATLSHNSQPAVVVSWGDSTEGLGYSAKEIERVLESIIQSFTADWDKANPDNAHHKNAPRTGGKIFGLYNHPVAERSPNAS